MRRILLLAGALVVTSLLAMTDGFARYEGPWCMGMSMGQGGMISRCDMRSYEMCRAEMGGLGGTYCTQNPYYRGEAAAPARTRKASRRSY